MQKFFLLGAALSFLALGASAEVENTVEMDSLLEAQIAAWDKTLDEVVVTGQGGAVSKRRLSSNITKLSSSDLEHLRASRIDQMLQNALPNVQFTLTNGQPGTTSIIKSRGLSSAFTNSTPVIYVDGVRVDNLNTGSSLFNVMNNAYGDINGQTAASGAIGDIPMENIDHIEYVPGGAATTLYGSDAANGVIQIFTKNHGQGRFSAALTVQMGADVASSQFYHFDRTKDLLHRPGFQQRYALSLSGGNERMGYSLGASMSQNTGTLIHDGNKQRKYDIRFGSAITLCKPLKYTNSFAFVAENHRRNRSGNQGYYTGLWFAEGSAAANFTYTGQDGQQHNFSADIDAATPYEFQQMKEFVSQAEALQDHNESVKRFQTSQQLEYTPMRNLTFHATIGVDYRYNTDKLVETNRYLIHTQMKPQGTTDAGSVANYDRNYYGITGELNGQWKYYKNEDYSNILTAGFQYFSTHDHQSFYKGQNVRDGARVMTGAGTIYADEWLSYLHNYGVYVQDNFGWRNRYYIDLGLRMDYNTAFGEQVGWQVYPKVGLSYILTDEPWMRRVVDGGWINSFKLMGNYGVAGSYPPAFEYQRTIDVSSYLDQQANTFGKNGNPNLGPEKKYSHEIGFQGTFFHRYLDLGLTYYYALTRHALFNVPTLPSSGQSSSYLANIGRIRNKGFEAYVGVNILNARDWGLNVRASFNTNDNIVQSTGGLVPFAIGGFSSRTIVTVVEQGKSVGFLRGTKTILNDDGTVAETLYNQDLGRTVPRYYGNFSIAARWRNLNFTLMGDYQAGAYVHSFDRQFRFAKGVKDDVIPEAALEGTTQAKSWLNFTNFFVEKADFVKIRDIGVDYTFQFAGCAVRSLNLALNIYNPLAWTSSSVDPEAVLSGARTQGAVATGGLSYSSYSQPRQYVFTAKVSF
ncbi:MAG: TonB-dependent receptor [Muribaculaceae bacterium]|nr:TonB-dependent receptor [Muribaculaceae bacterium]